ncbi:MAG TPA: PAS domain S-box protein [Methanobacteriaceae archaeon]|nr:PAS domain S-box protein [Methanobacteriaceae archaeon]
MAKILVVEDEALVALQIKNQLETWGFQVLQLVSTGEEAVEIALKLRPDIILMDIVLKGDMDGIEASKIIKKDLDIPIIYLTAYDDQKTMERAKKTMPSFYILKPFDSRELKFNIESALYRREIEIELKKTEKKIEKMTQASPIPQFFIDSDHRVVYWNQALEVHTGINSKDIVGTKDHWKAFYSKKRPCMADFLIDGDLDGLKDSYKELNQSKLVSGAFEAVDFFPNLGESGEWLYFTAKVIEDDDGNIVGALETLEDVTKSKLAQNKVEDQLNFLQKLMDTIPFPIFHKDKNFIYGGCNKAFEEFLGMPKEEIVGKTAFDVSPDDLARVYYKKDEELFSKGGSQTYESQVQYADGTRHEMLFNKTTFDDPDGNLAGLIGVMVDITERRTAEESLKESEARYRTIFENTGAATLIFNDKGIITMVNGEMENISGYLKEEVEGKMNWKEFVPLNELELMLEYHQAREIDPESVPSFYEAKFLNRSGDILTAQITIDKIPGTKEWVTSLLDITDLKTAEKSLKESEANYRNIFENAGTAIAISEVDMIISQANTEFAKLTGYSLDQIEGKVYWTEFISPEDVERMKEYHHLRRIDPEAVPKSYEARFVDGYGNLKDIFVNVAIIPGTNKSLVSLLDITERKQSRKMLQRELSVTKSLANIYKPLVSPGSSIEDIAMAIMKESKDLTGSVHSYVSSIDSKTDDNIYHTFTSAMPKCEVSKDKKRIYSPRGDYGLYPGLWGYSLNTKEAFFTNNPLDHPSSDGVPEGHVKLERFLSVPVLLGDKLVGQIALANPDRDYDQHDIDAVKRLAEFYALAIQNKRAEDQIKTSLNEKEVLLQEIHHRVKNNMQIISSLLNLQTQYVDDEAADVLKESQNRVRSMAIIHEKLYQSRDFSRINFAEYIEKLVTDLFYSYAIDEERIKPVIIVDDVKLGIETAIPCGLIVNELVSNSLKYAFPEGDGELLVDLHRVDDEFQLTVADTGVGLPTDLNISDSPSLGLKLVESLVIQLDGELLIDRSEGVAFIIRFKELEYKERVNEEL